MEGEEEEEEEGDGRWWREGRREDVQIGSLDGRW